MSRFKSRGAVPYHGAIMSPDDPRSAAAPETPPPDTDEMPAWFATYGQAEANRVGRNELCPCRSGLKFKRCCQRRLKARSLRQSFRPIPPTSVLRHLEVVS